MKRHGTRTWRKRPSRQSLSSRTSGADHLLPARGGSDLDAGGRRWRGPVPLGGEPKGTTGRNAYALHAAVHAKNPQKIIALVQSRTTSVNRRMHGWPPLHYAASKGSLDVLKALFDMGADVNAQDSDGWSALHIAAWRGDADVCDALLSAGCKPNLRTKQGQTALHKAVAAKSLPSVVILLKHGASAALRNGSGRTAEDIATSKRMVRLLKRAASSNPRGQRVPPPIIKVVAKGPLGERSTSSAGTGTPGSFASPASVRSMASTTVALRTPQAPRAKNHKVQWYTGDTPSAARARREMEVGADDGDGPATPTPERKSTALSMQPPRMTVDAVRLVSQRERGPAPETDASSASRDDPTFLERTLQKAPSALMRQRHSQIEVHPRSSMHMRSSAVNVAPRKTNAKAPTGRAHRASIEEVAPSAPPGRAFRRFQAVEPRAQAKWPGVDRSVQRARAAPSAERGASAPPMTTQRAAQRTAVLASSAAADLPARWQAMRPASRGDATSQLDCLLPPLGRNWSSRGRLVDKSRAAALA